VGFAKVFTETGSPSFWLDSAENAAHTGLGLASLAAVFVPGLNTALAPRYRTLVGVVAVIALFFGAYGFLLPAGSSAHPNTFGAANLESPADNLLHLVIGSVAMAAFSLKPRGGTMAG
jgi:hypothetical protein